jgi:hypothetical protein
MQTLRKEDYKGCSGVWVLASVIGRTVDPRDKADFSTHRATFVVYKRDP